jgi:hypothetical protein
MVLMKKPENLDFETWPTAIIRPKSQNSDIRHDDILSIGNFMMMMINNQFALFQLPGNLLKRDFLFIFIIEVSRYTGFRVMFYEASRFQVIKLLRFRGFRFEVTRNKVLSFGLRFESFEFWIKI